MKSMKLKLALSLCLLGSAPLPGADSQTDLRNALARLSAREPLRAAADYQLWQSAGTDKQPKIVQGRIQALVEDGPTGLRLTWPTVVLDQARKEAKRRLQDPESPDPVRTAMRELDVIQVRTCMDASEELLQELDQAQLLDERPETWQGRSALLLTFRLEPRLPQEAKKALKKLDASLKLWISPDGTPLASSTVVFFKASKLLIALESTQKEDRTFAVQGGRLVVTRQVQEESTSAMGDRSDTKKVLTLAFQ